MRTDARLAPIDWLALAVGGAVGTVLRLTTDLTLHSPWALVLVNVLGAAALLLLLLGVWPRRPRAPRWLREGLGTGVLGAFTTLSGVSLAVVSPTGAPVAGSAAILLAAVCAGAIGTLLRATAMATTVRLRFPLGVLLVNVLGSLMAGIALAGLLRGELDPGLAVVVIGGGCGGLTTFSTVIADTMRAWLARRRWTSLTILVTNLALGAGAAWLGLHA